MPGQDDGSISLVDENNRRYCLIAAGKSPTVEETSQSGWMTDLLTGERAYAEQSQNRGVTSTGSSVVRLWRPDD
jgi:hypothetical protein